MNITRIDLSDNLIHFVSPLDKSTKDYNLSEMHPKVYELNGDIVEEDKLSPFFILRRIIKNLQIISTWSYRKGQRTIYGSYPAVCLTEMPISEFVKTSIDRENKGQKISNYGLVFNKKELFNIGARPVIYGTSCDVSVFCLLHHTDKQTVDPLNLNQWEFYVLATEELNNYERSQHSITLNSLKKLTNTIDYVNLAAEIENKNKLNKH